VEVHLLPLQPEQFSTSQTSDRGKEDECVEWISGKIIFGVIDMGVYSIFFAMSRRSYRLLPHAEEIEVATI